MLGRGWTDRGQGGGIGNNQEKTKEVFQGRSKRNITATEENLRQSKAETVGRGVSGGKGPDGWDDRAGSVRMSEAPVFWICAGAVVWALS